MSDTNTKKWKDLDWSLVEFKVFRTQRRIYESAKRRDTTTTHELQMMLVRSRSARLLAVKKAAQKSRGRNTAGVDGEKSLDGPQMMRMADTLDIRLKPLPVKRIEIPKPWKKGTRKLGIPTMRDRAIQHLINMAMEPQIETILSPGQYGFRKGRSQHDALAATYKGIRRAPRYVLCMDIEQFFDKISHEALLYKLEAPAPIKKAIQRMLKAKVLDGTNLMDSEDGTPQGGPLSPLLANLALSGLEEAVLERFNKKTVVQGIRLTTLPRVIIYADDGIILHPRKDVLLEIQQFIDNWLNGFGLNLNQDKTEIVHTSLKENGTAGFGFLGCHIQQHPVGKHQLKSHSYFEGHVPLIIPGKASQRKFLHNLQGVINKHTASKKRKGKHRQEQKLTGVTGQSILIYALNPIIRGWCNYHRYQNAKRTFSKMDNIIHWKLRKWIKRIHFKGNRARIRDEFFDGGNPWVFKTKNRQGDEVALLRCDKTEIVHHVQVDPTKSWFDGDWPYWTKRSTRYPGVPKALASRLKSQKSKCHDCGHLFARTDRVHLSPKTGMKGRPYQAGVCSCCINSESGGQAE